MHDAEAVHLLGANVRQIARCGCIDDDLIACGQLVGLADFHGLAVVGHGHVAVTNPPGGAGARRVEGTGERGVQAHTGERAFNGEFGADAGRIFGGVGGFAHAALLRVVFTLVVCVRGCLCENVLVSTCVGNVTVGAYAGTGSYLALFSSVLLSPAGVSSAGTCTRVPLRFRPLKFSRTMNAMHTQIAESAILKIAKFGTEIKSTT